MRLLRSNKTPRSGEPPRRAPQLRVVNDSAAEPASRYEPETLVRRRACADPYALWLAEREAERERRERPEIKWVYRYPRVTRPAGAPGLRALPAATAAGEPQAEPAGVAGAL